MFSDQVNECVSKLIGKQPAILSETLKYMSRHWPCADCKKQGAYLTEVQFLLISNIKELNEDHIKAAFLVINNAVDNESSEIVDRAIGLLTNSKIIDIVMKFSAVIYPIIFENLYKTAKSHWDECARENSLTALKGLQAIDPELFQKMNEERAAARQARKVAMVNFQETWLKILDGAKVQDPGIGKPNFDCF
jgi:hypothetical protein